MTARRLTDPVYLQYIWDSVEVPSADQICTFDHILRYIRNEKDNKCNPAKLQEQLGNAVRDRSIVVKDSYYRKPDWSSLLTNSKHDWYCFHCNTPGPVIECPTCFRVYHEACFKRSIDSNSFVDFPDENYRSANASNTSCITCRRLNNTQLSNETKPHLRKICRIIASKMQGKTSWLNLCTVGYVEELNRNKYFCIKQINTNIIASKLSDGYSTRAHLLADLDLLVHNVAIIYGTKAEMTVTARNLRTTIQKELMESAYCVDCYVRSNGGKADRVQIVSSCPRPHELVWYQYGSWAFRPCKVLYKNDETYELISFDNRRERLSAPKNSVFAMCTSPINLGMTINSALKRALQDVKTYVENQQKVTPNFEFDFSVLNCDSIPKSPKRSNAVEDFHVVKSRKTTSSITSKTSSRSRRPASVTSKGKSEVSSFDKSPSSVLTSNFNSPEGSTSRPGAASIRNARIYTSGSDSDENSPSSSSSDSDSDYPPVKRSTTAYRPPNPSSLTVTAKPSPRSAVPSRSTFPTSNGLSSSARLFSGRATVTDSDSNPSLSPLVPSGSATNKKSSSPLPIFRKRSISTSSSDSASSDKSVLSSLTKSSKKKKKRASNIALKPSSTASKPAKQETPYSTSKKTQSEGTKGLPNRGKRNGGGHSLLSTTTAKMPSLESKRNFIPVNGTSSGVHNNNNGVPSISSASPAALSSSSGIGSAMDASPVDSNCNGHNCASHTVSAEEQTRLLMAANAENEKLRKQIKDLQRQILEMGEQHAQELKEAKRHEWCRLCLKRSMYYCCPGASYCSTDCQKADWDAGHSQFCRRLHNF